MPLSTTRPIFSRSAQPSALVGVPAGLVAGIAYLLAQSAFSVAAGGTGSEPFQRISAMLLGPDALPPPSEWTSRAVSMALLIHLPLAAIYGRLVDLLVMRMQGLGIAAVTGALAGAGLFVVNRLLIAPSVFPWFDASRDVVTAADHVLFGVVAAVLCVTLRRHFAAKGRL